MGISTYIRTAWKYVHMWMTLTTLFLIFEVFLLAFLNSFDAHWITKHKLGSADLFSAEDTLIQPTCNRLVSNYGLFTWIYLFKLTFCHKHSTVLAGFSCSCCMQTSTHGMSLQPTSWSEYSYGKKSIQHAIKEITVTTALLLANTISVYFLDPFVTEGAVY